MDRHCPPGYIEPSAFETLDKTKELICHIRSQSSPQSAFDIPLVQPILTPRFAISCTPTLLSSHVKLAASDLSLAIQTHLSENKSEIAMVLGLFPDARSY